MDIFVCAVADFPRGTRRLIKAGLRNIAVYNVKGQYYAIDNACYHHGGPLLNGDIEDLGGHPCVKCPWHSYKITLDTGEGLYWGVDVGHDSKPQPILKSKGPKQRTHHVFTRGGDVFCHVDASEGSFESDTYAEMTIANREDATPSNSRASHGTGGDRIHSGLGGGQPQVTDHNRSGAALGGGGGSKFTVTSSSSMGAGPDWRRATSTGKSRVRLIKASPASGDGLVATFTFDRASIGDRRVLDPGMWVKLRIPLSAEVSIDRTWTVTHVRGPLGGWFSCTVKRRDDGEGGSRWLHSDEAKTRDLEVLEVGGTFTMKHLTSRILDRGGRVAMFSAGIGITPMYASLAAHASDPFATISGPVIHVAHLHSERSLDNMAFAEELGQMSGVYGHVTPGSTSEPFGYKLQVLTSAPLPTGPSRPLDVLRIGATVSGGERLSLEHVSAVLTRLEPAHDPSKGPRSVLVMTCGPAAYMQSVKAFCVACGVLESDVVHEDF